MNNHKISIIIPIYNAENTLERCIQRIIEQSYPNWELLLIDDGSVDNSCKICEDACLKDKRITTIHKENGGVSSARNVGIAKASGEWITFCDSDDYVEKYWLQNFVEVIERKDAPELLFVQKIRVYKQGVFDSIYYENEHGFIPLSEFLLGHFGFVWNKIFKREILKQHQICFDEHIHLFEDEVFVLQYLSWMKGVFITINEAEYNYEWPNYSHKYRHDINDIYTQLRLYLLAKSILSPTKKGYRVLIYKFLNRLLFKTIQTIAYQGHIDDNLLQSIISTIRKDIFHVVRRTFFPLKFLFATSSLSIWKVVFSGYAFLVRRNILHL